MATESITYDKAQLRGILQAFKGMDEQAVSQAKAVSNGLATYVQSKIISSASGRPNQAAARIAQGSRVSKSSKIGELSFGFVSQKFSGGGTTQQLWGGYEFGSNKFKQFPVWSGREGRGSRGYFIYPTLRAEQPHIINEWENAFTKILKEW
jgi:broad specificity phosphatase PhoE